MWAKTTSVSTGNDSPRNSGVDGTIHRYPAEEFAGFFPTWLAPVQVVIMTLPILSLNTLTN